MLSRWRERFVLICRPQPPLSPPGPSWVKTIGSGNFEHTRGYEFHRNMVSSTHTEYAATALGDVSHVRDALGRIVTLDRENGMYNLYSGGGIRQGFAYTSKGELESATTSQLSSSGIPMPGRSIGLTYDGQGNRKRLEIDGALSHQYTPGPANEYTAVSYSNHVGAISGMAENPDQVLVGNQPAQRQEDYFWRGYAAGTSAGWTMENVFAAAPNPPGDYVTQYRKGEKEAYLPPASVSPIYDTAGNLKSDGWWTYTYDGENRLIRQVAVVLHPDGRTRELSFAYDYLGRRVRKKVVAVNSMDVGVTLSDTAFAYWEWHLLAEVNLLSSSLTRHYTWGLDKEGVRPGAGGVGGLLQIVDHGLPKKTYFAMNDYLGNVIGLVDTVSGVRVAEYEYDPFGRSLRATGTYAHENPIRFSSQYWDEETGLVYFGFRYYHPQWGRFLNRDPLEEEGGINLYRFVSNDPVNRWDLLGLEPKASLTLTNHGTVTFPISQGTHSGGAYAGNHVTFNATIEGVKSNDIIVSQQVNSSTFVTEDGSVHINAENTPDGGKDGNGEWYNGSEGSDWSGGNALTTDDNGKPVGLSPEVTDNAEEPSTTSITFHDGPGMVYKPDQIPVTKTGSFTTTISQASTGEKLAEAKWESSTSVDKDGGVTTEFSVNESDQPSTNNDDKD